MMAMRMTLMPMEGMTTMMAAVMTQTYLGLMRIVLHSQLWEAVAGLARPVAAGGTGEQLLTKLRQAHNYQLADVDVRVISKSSDKLTWHKLMSKLPSKCLAWNWQN